MKTFITALLLVPLLATAQQLVVGSGQWVVTKATKDTVVLQLQGSQKEPKKKHIHWVGKNAWWHYRTNCSQNVARVAPQIIITNVININIGADSNALMTIHGAP